MCYLSIMYYYTIVAPTKLRIWTSPKNDKEKQNPIENEWFNLLFTRLFFLFSFLFISDKLKTQNIYENQLQKKNIIK